jgi:hypothetical protein
LCAKVTESRDGGYSYLMLAAHERAINLCELPIILLPDKTIFEQLLALHNLGFSASGGIEVRIEGGFTLACTVTCVEIGTT